jgi:signal transduction histidine kinase
MGTLVYIRLIAYTAGTLLQLFWMVVILGYRRQRNFERIFFFLCLSLFLFYGGSLLALNSQIYYAQPPQLLTTFAWTVLSMGLCFAPALLLHVHLEYADMRGLIVRPKGDAAQWKRMILTFSYALTVFFAIRAYPKLIASENLDFLVPSKAFGNFFGIFLATLMGGSAGWEFRFARATTQKTEKAFHVFVGTLLAAGMLLTLLVHLSNLSLPAQFVGLVGIVLAFLSIAPFAVLIYGVQKYNFLQIGRQKNLMYAISVTFLALLYLSLVRRAGGLFESVLPPEATAAVLLFVLVIFVEPIQRVLGRHLHETAQHEMENVGVLITEIRMKAREGNLRKLIQFVGHRVQTRFEFEDAWLRVMTPPGYEETLHEGKTTDTESFLVRQADWLEGALYVRPHGAMLSGEARAALEFLCEQLPGDLDLCRLIEEKLQLERELAERERLAVLGQMAASISHNLKNPLGSIKTILQVQLESAELPESIRGETKMVLEEIGRLSSKLNQLLQFSRPAIRGGVVVASCDARVVAEEVSGVLRHEAERRGVAFDVAVLAGGAKLAASAEAVSEILSNLVVNALEATTRGGYVKVSGSANGDGFLFAVEDDGPGVPESVREKILQPFFTTKTQGTGLGLAIVARRVAEFGGKLDWESPVRDGRGTRFRVILPL